MTAWGDVRFKKCYHCGHYQQYLKVWDNKPCWACSECGTICEVTDDWPPKLGEVGPPTILCSSCGDALRLDGDCFKCVSCGREVRP